MPEDESIVALAAAVFTLAVEAAATFLRLETRVVKVIRPKIEFPTYV